MTSIVCSTPTHFESVQPVLFPDSQAENFERLSPNVNGNDTPRGAQFDVVLTKDPANGLGLTLVDGNLNGVPGVYVKLVADNGAGMKAVSVNCLWFLQMVEDIIHQTHFVRRYVMETYHPTTEVIFFFHNRVVGESPVESVQLYVVLLNRVEVLDAFGAEFVSNVFRVDTQVRQAFC